MTLNFYFGPSSLIPFHLRPAREFWWGKNCFGMVFSQFPQVWYFRLMYACRCPLPQIHCRQQTKDVPIVFGVITNEVFSSTLTRILQSWQKWGQVKNQSLLRNLWNPAKPLWQRPWIANALLIFSQWIYIFQDPCRHTRGLPSDCPPLSYCCLSYSSRQFSDADG